MSVSTPRVTARSTVLPRALPERVRRASRPAVSARTRILGWFLLLVVVTLAVAVVLVRQVLSAHVRDQIDASLQREVVGVRQVAAGADPATGVAFASTAALLRSALTHDLGELSGGSVALLDGVVVARQPGPTSERLAGAGTLLPGWAAAAGPRLGSSTVDGTRLRWVAVPLSVTSDGGHGVLVAAIGVREPMAEVSEVTGILVRVAVLGLVIASVLAWAVAGRVLAPVRQVTDAARTLSEHDLSRRLPVRGRDEIAGLSAVFNTMLGRLETSFRAQRAFVDDAGHELRTPLTIVCSYLELVERGERERAEALPVIRDELARMTRLVDDLLALARAEQPDLLRLDVVDVPAMVDRVLLKARGLGRREWRRGPVDDGWLFADEQRVEQALLQLAQNAVEHTRPAGAITVAVTAADDNVRLTVRDDGEGVSPADAERLFARFSRGEGARGRASGSGLGLAIVAAIAAAHGGVLELDSAGAGDGHEDGRGAAFTLVLPRNGPREATG